jgi:hypothetical protein
VLCVILKLKDLKVKTFRPKIKSSKKIQLSNFPSFFITDVSN